MSNQNNENDSGLSNFVALPLLAFLLGWGGWYLYGTTLLTFAFKGSVVPFEWFSNIPPILLPTGINEQYVMVAAQMRGADPAAYGWGTFQQIVALWGYTLRLLLVPLLGYVAVINFKLPVNYYYRRSLSLKELAEQNAALFPCTRPALGKDLHKTSSYTGPWRIADDYIDFASFNGLLLYKGKPIDPTDEKSRALSVKKKRKLFPHYSYVTLNKEKADALYINQLGKPWRGLGGLDPLQKGLAAALMAMTAGGEYRQKGRDLLDQLSRTYEEEDLKCKTPHKADLEGALDLATAVENNADVKEIITSHAFESTVFIALLVAARLKAGKVPPSSFLWLRPTDRTLWYSLHPIGGRKPWSEGAAAWGHYYAEMDMGRAIGTPIVEPATDSLESELYNEKWVFSQSLAEKEVLEQKEEKRMLEEATKAMESKGVGGKRGRRNA